MFKALSFAAVLGGLILLSLGKVEAAAPDFSVCDGLTGAAWGLCRGGVAAGCADGTGSPTACALIEENFSAVTGEEAPWVIPPEPCPCDYSFYVPLTVATWSDSAGPKQVAFTCPDDKASVVAVSPLPQFPQVQANRLVDGTPICQALPQEPALGVSFGITEAELRGCRIDAIAYGISLKAIYPTALFEDFCTVASP